MIVERTLSGTVEMTLRALKIVPEVEVTVVRSGVSVMDDIGVLKR